MLTSSAAMVAGMPANSAELATYLGFAGFGLWTLAYLVIIWKGHKDQTYGVPLLAICLNVTWEAYFAVGCPLSPGRVKGICTAVGLERWGLIVWLVLDLWILGQLVHYGWRQPWLQRYLPGRSRRPAFNLMVAMLVAIAFVWQYVFVNITTDKDGNSLAWLTNLIMSFLFVRSAVGRPTIAGLSSLAGWAMLLGNLAFAATGYLTGFADFTAWPPAVTKALMFAVILLNCFYLLVLGYRSKRPAFGGQVPQEAL